ncbi:hypothetical protein IQ278_12105 [Tolypothrix sp. LEGE 11397]|uniref:hypothetical protein n=1 Tax=Tolypothrix sp. LEGE 11397 TaxID=2777971 RepID=UPI001A0E422B|nr:hypothetical protein [Tolypothrix sp. LEGE 11397]MBE9082857.1 hypothetical protein [Tolypothrix sp. LEGE 11397]
MLYSLATFGAYFIIGSVFGQGTDSYIPYIGFLPYSIGQTIGLTIAGIVALYLQTGGIANAMEFYSYNKVGKGRASRVLFAHRDVTQLDTSWEAQWQSTKHYALFCDVLPANLIGIGILLGVLTFMAQGIGFLPFFYTAGFCLLGGLSYSYATNHLCNPELSELYERPQTYDNAFTRAKQEIREQIAVKQAQETLEKERKRNSPLPPQSPTQQQPPRKPY